MSDMNVKQEEMRSTREVVRELGSILGQLEDGSVRKIVIMSGKTMKGVLISVDEYANLTTDAA